MNRCVDWHTLAAERRLVFPVQFNDRAVFIPAKDHRLMSKLILIEIHVVLGCYNTHI